MIYGNKFLKEYTTDEEMKNLVESIRYDLLNEDCGILQESIIDKLSTFFTNFKKRIKGEVIKIGQAETVLKMDIKRIKLSKDTITFNKPKVIEELNWNDLFTDISKCLNMKDAKKIASDMIDKYYDTHTDDFEDKTVIEKYEKEIEEVKQKQATMFPNIVFQSSKANMNKLFTSNTDNETFMDEFRDLFQDENLKKNGFLKTREFKNSDEVNKYISNIEDIQDKIGKMGNDILQSMQDVILECNKALGRIGDHDENGSVRDKYLNTIFRFVLSITVSYYEIYNQVARFAIKALKHEQSNVKKLDYTGKIK